MIDARIETAPTSAFAGATAARAGDSPKIRRLPRMAWCHASLPMRHASHRGVSR